MLRAWCLLGLVTTSFAASAVVGRHDVDDARYRIAGSDFPALVDMPSEGHGVLIAPRWVVTAAHTLPMHSELGEVEINGRSRQVERVVTHPGYRTLPQPLIDQATASGEAMLIVVFLAATDDIALIKLQHSVTDVAPVGLHRTGDEAGRTIKLVGKGAAGTGDTGHSPNGPNRTELRRAFNTVSSAWDRWLCYVFDAPPEALPLEGTLGNGDSGGPLLVEVDDDWRVAGLGAWKVVSGDVRTARPGRYGQTACNVRLSHYADWIKREISPPPASGPTP
ncbi:S1 family peptidase [Luteimonas deserti]|uniref:Trypsin-like serine protease n=1 Tax=Luteimonas deserti TaxID=2752306 RepID=A0A7Z0QQA5_9GAMM|nr:trypsin-like serine protease [Luteimonas deserti]NYZ61862.1 trypsin-like serine protease [Luteimonas deserti]